MSGATSADAAIMAAYEARRGACAKLAALPAGRGPVIAGYAPGERDLWSEVDAAEEVIRAATATTLPGVMIQLRCAAYHAVWSDPYPATLHEFDLAAIDDTAHLDWDARLSVAAMRSLNAMIAGGQPDRAAWDAGLADYQAKRAISDAMPLGTNDEDAAVDAYCVAMDRLIREIPAPDLAAASIKADLAALREGCHDLWLAVQGDLRRLSGRGAA